MSPGSDLLPTAPQGSLPGLLLQFGSAGKNLLYLILFLLTCTLWPSLLSLSLRIEVKGSGFSP